MCGRDHDSGIVIYIDYKNRKTQRSSPLHQPGLANEEKPALADYQYFEKDIE